MTFYSVYVGRFKDQKDCKPVQKKLNDLGLAGYIFSLGDCFSIKTKSFAYEVQAKQLAAILKSYDFDAFVKN